MKNHKEFIQFLSQLKPNSSPTLSFLIPTNFLSSFYGENDVQIYLQQVNAYAELLSYNTSVMLKQITLSDLLDKKVLAQLAQRFANGFNAISYRIKEDILTVVDNPQVASKVYTFWIDVAIKAYELKNLEIVQAILAGVDSPDISRLFAQERQYHRLISENTCKKLQELSDLKINESLINQIVFLPPFLIFLKALAASLENNNNCFLSDSTIKIINLLSLFRNAADAKQLADIDQETIGKFNQLFIYTFNSPRESNDFFDHLYDKELIKKKQLTRDNQAFKSPIITSKTKIQSPIIQHIHHLPISKFSSCGIDQEFKQLILEIITIEANKINNLIQENEINQLEAILYYILYQCNVIQLIMNDKELLSAFEKMFTFNQHAIHLNEVMNQGLRDHEKLEKTKALVSTITHKDKPPLTTEIKNKKPKNNTTKLSRTKSDILRNDPYAPFKLELKLDLSKLPKTKAQAQTLTRHKTESDTLPRAKTVSKIDQSNTSDVKTLIVAYEKQIDEKAKPKAPPLRRSNTASNLKSPKHIMLTKTKSEITTLTYPSSPT
ncbi:RasGEF domain-containing protein [Thiotrichales bacterium 19S3-7]|nr:RasGEF domain-containing protein [Thiotrichales bacterium 19S3-7]MCF6800628.1 RasGEF domain-containing protein [Thiotrichales bacterium 19S3-11]